MKKVSFVSGVAAQCEGLIWQVQDLLRQRSMQRDVGGRTGGKEGNTNNQIVGWCVTLLWNKIQLFNTHKLHKNTPRLETVFLL